MNASLPSAAPTLIDQHQQNVVLFRLDKHLYAVPIERVQQIIDIVTIAPIPQVLHSVAGMINYHGKTLPVVNLRRHLGLTELPPRLHTPIILVNLRERLLGLLVDDVLAVQAFSPEKMINPAEVLPVELGNVPMILGLTQTSQGMVILLDLEQLFKGQQAWALFDAAEAVEAVSQLGEGLEPQDEPTQPVKRKASRGGREKASQSAASVPAAESDQKAIKKSTPKVAAAAPEEGAQAG